MISLEKDMAVVTYEAEEYCKKARPLQIQQIHLEWLTTANIFHLLH